MEGLILAWTGLLGACVGSFTNVVAWRLPRQESVVFPGSHCPKCGHAIRWHDNLPVLGWLLLRGHCRDCDAAISWRYPAVEALSAGLWISALLVWPGAGGGLPDLWLPWAGLPLIALLLPLVLIDLDHLWLPEPLSRWGGVLGAGLAAVGRSQCPGRTVVGTACAGPGRCQVGGAGWGMAGPRGHRSGDGPCGCLGSFGWKRRSPQWPVGPQGTVPLRSLHCPGHLAGLVDRSAVVVEHLGDAVGRLIPQRRFPVRLLMV